MDEERELWDHFPLQLPTIVLARHPAVVGSSSMLNCVVFKNADNLDLERNVIANIFLLQLISTVRK